MSILENKIDAIGLEQSTDEVILTISDHLDWINSDYHLNALQDKINSYLEYIESGQIVESYPDSIGKKVRIEIVAKFEFPTHHNDFLIKTQTFLEKIGVSIGLKYLG